MKDLLFSRTIKNKCPICDKQLDKESVTVAYEDAKLEVCKKHIKYKEKPC